LLVSIYTDMDNIGDRLLGNNVIKTEIRNELEKIERAVNQDTYLEGSLIEIAYSTL